MRRTGLALLLTLPGCSDDAALADTSSSSTSLAPDPSTGEAPTSSSSSSTGDPPGTTPGDPPDPTTTSSTSSTGTTGEPPDPVCAGLRPCDPCTCTDLGWACDCPPLAPEAGYIELEAVEFVVGEGAKAQARTSDPTRIFYSYRPAVDPGGDGPLFVLFNGGPGSSTGTLMAFGTGPVSLAPEPVANPGSWATLGDLLYIEARGTGFSYNLADDPAPLATRSDAFGINNYNSYLDAADVVRVLLRFLLAHPQLTRREVILVGESYGGVRAQVMLAMLLYSAEHDAGGPALYDDPALVDEVEAYLAALDPDAAWTPAEVAARFPRQVLIQPSLGGVQRTIAGQMLDQPGSPVFQLADELGQEFVPCSEQGADCLPWQNAVQYVEGFGRSRYDLSAPVTWLADLFAAKKAGLSNLEHLEAVLGVPPAGIPFLPARERAGAFRIAGLGTYPPDGGTVAQLGALEPWDRYYLPFLAESNNAMRSPLADHVGIGADDPHYGALFLRNLVHVDTFITAATRDIAIYAPSIPPALATYEDIVLGVDVLPGEFTVQYAGAPFPDEPAPGLRTVRFPLYDAAHTVSIDQPVALRDDVGEWLAGR